MTAMSTDMFYSRNTFTNKCLTVDFFLKMSGDSLEFNNQEVGYTMRFMRRSLSSFFSEGQSLQIPKRVWFQLDILYTKSIVTCFKTLTTTVD